jgi:hypothetical protein
MDVTTIVERKHEIRTLPQPPQYVRQRIAQAAQELDKAGSMAIHIELANEALCKLTAMLYRCDSDGFFANVDNRTGRLLVPAPWGNAGWKRWGLRYWEACTLRGVLMARVTKPRHVALFDYNTVSRTWALDVGSYATLDKAQAYLQHCAVSLAEWRAHTKHP